jgi:tetratricopeptide (TPR) repeat protein
MNSLKKVLSGILAIYLIASILSNGIVVVAQSGDIVSTSDDISGSSGVFVFRQSRKSNQSKVAFRKVSAKRTVTKKTETRKKVKQQIQVARISKPQRVKPVPSKKPINPAIKPPNVNQKPNPSQIDMSIAFAAGAEEYLKRDEIEKAVPLFRKSIEFDPKNQNAKLGLSEALTLQADRFFESTSAESAAFLYEEAIKNDANNSAAYAGLGEAYDSIGEDTSEEKGSEFKSKAIAAYEKAIQLNSALSELFAPLGILYVAKGEIAKADSTLSKAVAANPDDSEVQYFLGLVRYKQNKNSEAIESFKQSIRTEPNFANAHYYLGEVYDRLDRDKDAIDSYNEAVRLNPKFVEAWFDLGVSNYNRGKYEEAVTAYKSAIRLKGDYTEARTNLADVYRQLKRFEDAIGEYRIAATLVERDDTISAVDKADVFGKFGYCSAAAQKWDTAIENMEKALKYRQDDQVYSNLGWAYYNSASVDLKDRSATSASKKESAKVKLQKGKQALQNAVSLNPSSVGGFLNLGVTLIGTGEFPAAIEALVKADELKKDWDIAKFELGFVYQLQKDWKNASTQFKRVTELNKNNFEAFYRWGIAENALGNKDKAKDILKELKKFNVPLAKAWSQELDLLIRGAVLKESRNIIESKVNEKNPLKKIPGLPKIPYFQ